MVFLPQTKFNRFGLFALALAGLVVLVGVLAVPTPEKAWATDLDVTLTVEWVLVQPYNIQAQVRLLNSNMEPVTPWENLQPNPEFDQWTTTLINISTESVFYQITYLGGLFNWWPDDNPFGGEIVWDNDNGINAVLINEEE